MSSVSLWFKFYSYQAFTVVTTQTKLPDPDDTIVALSSAAGAGARAIVRLSGRRATAIATLLCAEFEKDRIRAGRFFQGSLPLPGFYTPLPADLYYFAAPHSYTGQDVIEIHTLSSAPIVEVLIAACLDAGARTAQRGEFTLRAFLAGKLDLTRAEAVLGVIEATRRDDLKHALKQLAGGLAQPLRELREDLLNLLADVEACLDFSEEDIHFVAPEAMLMRLAKGLAYLTLLSKQIETRAMGQHPFRVVLAGPPNAGKSSLFNALVGQDAALVNPQPGTTRDYLEQTIDIDGVALQLVDTAGLRDSSDSIEVSAQTLGQEQAGQADLLLWCCPCDEGVPADAIPTDEYWPIKTKVDLVVALPEILAISCVTGEGLPQLRECLASHVRRSGHAAMAPSLSRCRHHIEACLQNLRQAHAIVLNQEMPELLALELRLALEELGAMAGAVYTDNLLERIFSRFCIGK